MAYLFSSGCEGVVSHESCIFLGKRQTNRDGAVTICEDNDAELAVLTNQNEANIVHDYIRHSDVMAERATAYIWTNMQVNVSMLLMIAHMNIHCSNYAISIIHILVYLINHSISIP